MVNSKREDLERVLGNYMPSDGDSTKPASAFAYAFFDCRAPKRKLEAELKSVKKITETPEELNLYLTEGINIKEFYNPELRSIAEEAKSDGIKYVMKGSYAGKRYSNEGVASLMAVILSKLYQTGLYREGEPFRVKIVYESSHGKCREMY